MVDTLRRSPDDFSSALRRRARLFRLARVGVIAGVVAYFFLPYGVRSVIPAWLVFLLALALEAQFFVGGWLKARRGVVTRRPDGGPQPRDLAELGSPWWWRVPLEEEEPRPWRRWGLEAAAALAIVGVILFFAVRPEGWDAISSANKARAEAVFSREASLIAGHEAQVTCDERGEFVGFVQDADGSAEVGGRQAYLTPAICDTLYQLAFKERVQSFSRTARAIAVLAHEAQHLRGVRNEGLANCYGFQSGVELGVNLGLSEERARAMMREQLATPPPSPEYRVPGDCRVD